MNPLLDDKDHEIIRLLKRDGRASIRDIAIKTGIKPSTAHQRIQRMQSNGVIEKFTLKLHGPSIGHVITVFLFCSTDKRFEDSAFQNDCIEEVFRISGEYDLLLKLKFSNLDDYNNFLVSFKNVYGISKTNSIITTKTIIEN